MTKFAIIRTGGKQYKVSEGDIVEVEKLPKKEGAKVSLTDVLLVNNGRTVKVGSPKVAKAKVEATVTKQKRAKKITVLKYKSKTRYRKKQGHRQDLTQLEITKIS